MGNPFDRIDEVAAPTAVSSERVWSAYQSAIFRNVAEGRGHTVVIARAGSGKTSTIVEAFKHIPRGCTTLMVAFNKSIATELKSRAPSSVEVSTLHSYGLRQVSKAFGRVPLDDKKLDGVVRSLVGDVQNYDLRRAICKIVSLAKSMLFSTAGDLDTLIDAYGIDGWGETQKERESAVNTARVAMALCMPQRTEDGRQLHLASMDFDDMIWLPVVCNLPTWKFDRVFIDETQDLSPAQIELALRAVKPGGRILAVGDDRQAIYGFRGADSRSIPNLIERLKAHVMPLSVTYRCARTIVGQAKAIVPDIEAAPGAAEGEVLSGSIEMMKNLAAPGDFILSRSNAPLVGLCLGFLREGRRAAVQGRDIGTQLSSLVKKSQARTVEELEGWVSVWGSKETERLLKKDADTQVVEDKVETVMALCEGAQSVAEVLSRIEALFSDQDDAARIVLSTTHKAKGLERDRVFVLRDTYMKRKTDEESNMLYVAVTRARKTLWYCYETPKGPAREKPVLLDKGVQLPTWADPEKTPVDPFAVRSGRVT